MGWVNWLCLTGLVLGVFLIFWAMCYVGAKSDIWRYIDADEDEVI